MSAAVGQGYATYGTNAGLGPLANGLTPASWALGADGEPNIRLLENFASASIYEGTVIAKNFTAAFYTEPARYSYFSSYSQGGRQGIAAAQRYPDLFDGITAAAPAINWNSLAIGGIYANFLINLYGVYPPSYEIEALTSTTIEAYDGHNSVLDRIISNPEEYGFDPVNLVGTTIPCAANPETDGDSPTTERKISLGAATIVQKTVSPRQVVASQLSADIRGVQWDGARRANNSRMWYGPAKDATLAGGLYPFESSFAPIGTVCSANGTCTLDPIVLFQEWTRLFVLGSSTTDTSKLSLEDYKEFFRLLCPRL
jgi:feruloyl esterase